MLEPKLVEAFQETFTLQQMLLLKVAVEKQRLTYGGFEINFSQEKRCLCPLSVVYGPKRAAEIVSERPEAGEFMTEFDYECQQRSNKLDGHNYWMALDQYLIAGQVTAELLATAGIEVTAAIG